MDHLNETYEGVMITDMETLYSFVEHYHHKTHMYGLWKNPNVKPGEMKIIPDDPPPKWVWRREKTPMAYKSLEWGNVLQTVKDNYWGRKIALFYNRMKVLNICIMLI